uniref:S-layer n=1 Tax=Viridibacillus arvi TaxID=263475 RepID=UPI00355C9F08
MASAVLVTGEVSNVDLDKTTITISEDGKTFNYNYEEAIFKLHNNVVSQSKFESLLFGATVTASKDDKGVLTLNIIDEGVDALEHHHHHH